MPSNGPQVLTRRSFHSSDSSSSLSSSTTHANGGSGSGSGSSSNNNNMNRFRSLLGSKRSPKSSTGDKRQHQHATTTTTTTTTPSGTSPSWRPNSGSTNPFSRTLPTRRPASNNNNSSSGRASAEQPPPYAPPAYSPAAPSVAAAPVLDASSSDSPYAFLATFDTLFLIDDSGSMAGRSWRETAAALASIAPVCTTHDADGIDIHFLNHRNPHSGSGAYEGVTSADGVDEIFASVRPMGGTPTGTRLNHILKPYLTLLEAPGGLAAVKPLNIIVVTDGVPSDDVESVIVSAARRLDKLGAEAWQVGIQFFQVGCEPEAAEMLRELDDVLGGEHGVRDMVDTVPWNGEAEDGLTGQGLLKVCLGSVVRRWDRHRL